MNFPLVLGVVVAVWLLLSRRRPMATREALALLELTPADGPEAIRAAHRRLIARVHPDAGGTRELASQVNNARDILIADWNRRASRAS
jgi:curved DNA-binding protein CbpA